MLIFANEDKGDGYDYINVFKTDGHGNYKVVKTLKVADIRHSLTPFDLFLTPDGDVMMKALDLNSDLITEDHSYQGFATVYILFAAEDLDIETRVVGMTEREKVKMYPNPVSDVLKIELENKVNGEIVIYDELGRKVISQKITKAEIIVDVSNLPSGVYITKLIGNDNSAFSGKFVKK